LKRRERDDERKERGERERREAEESPKRSSEVGMWATGRGR
jgi:hypothetical protein